VVKVLRSKVAFLKSFEIACFIKGHGMSSVSIRDGRIKGVVIDRSRAAATMIETY